MAATLKVYKTLVHSASSTSYAFVCASSKTQVAEILNTTVGQLNKYGCEPLPNNAPARLRFKNLKNGDVVYEDANKHQPKAGMSLLDLHRIAVLGYIDAALQALSQCDMPTKEMSNRLGELRGQLKELKADASEMLESKYSGR